MLQGYLKKKLMNIIGDGLYKRNWKSKGKKEIDSLEHISKYVHQFLFEITLEHSSSNTFFQISILCSRIETIEFWSILRNQTNYIRLHNVHLRVVG